MSPASNRREDDRVDIGGKVDVRLEDPGRVAGEGDELHQGPIAEQQDRRKDRLAPPRQVDQGDRRHQVADRDRLQRVAVQMQVVRIECQQVPLGHHAQHPQDEHAAEHVQVQCGFASARSQPFGEQEGHGRRPR